MNLLKISHGRKKSILFLISIACIIIIFLINNIYLSIVSIFIALLLVVNVIVYRKNSYNAKHMFSTVGRNYDYIVIGTFCNVENLIPEGKSRIEFLAPNRTIYASYQLVRRLYSLLCEESGSLIIVSKKSNLLSNRISIFDIPYLHDITLNLLQISGMKFYSYFPVFYSPIDSIKYFLMRKYKMKNMTDIEAPDEELMKFCKQRKINIIYKQII